MTEEEFSKLPSCIRYKDPSRDCPKINSVDWDDWDESEDCCQVCTGFPPFAREYYSGFMEKSYYEILMEIDL